MNFNIPTEMVDGYFFDILGEWKHFIPYLNNPRFLTAINLYHWWNSELENANLDPLLKWVYTPEETYVATQLDHPPNYTNPYWYSVPHECVELNTIVMGTLASLLYQQPMYYLGVSDHHNPHVVISNRLLDPGELIHFPRDKNGDLVLATQEDAQLNDRLILYDLIYPLSPFFGQSWRSLSSSHTCLLTSTEIPLDYVVVSHSSPLAENWTAMHYIKYPKLGDLMEII